MNFSRRITEPHLRQFRSARPYTFNDRSVPALAVHVDVERIERRAPGPALRPSRPVPTEATHAAGVASAFSAIRAPLIRARHSASSA